MTSKISDIDKQEIIKDFVERHNLQSNTILDSISTLIVNVCHTHILIHNEIPKIPESEYLEKPMFGVLLNLFDRSFEHIEGCLVSISARATPSSEVVARVAIESCVNLQYILKGDHLSRFEAYINHYFKSWSDQIRKWKNKVDSSLAGEEAKIHLKAIKERNECNDQFQEIMCMATKQLREVLNNSNSELWPSTVFKRFESLGLELEYRTIYSRLCSEIHGNAEETIRYFIMKTLADHETQNKMIKETIDHTYSMASIACLFFIDCAILYAECFKFKGLDSIFKKIRHEILEFTLLYKGSA